MVFGKPCQYIKKTKGGSDPKGLGCWVSVLMQASTQLRTQFVCVYNIGKPKPKGQKMQYQQALWYSQQEGLDTTSWATLRNDLTAQLKEWLQVWDRIFLYMEANEDVINWPLCHQLSELGFVAWTHLIQGKVLDTRVEGKEWIDEFWGLYDLVVTNIQVFSYH